MNPLRRGELWTNQEHDQLTSEMNAGMSLMEMCAAHERTPWAIVGRLQALGLITLRENGYHKVEADPWVLTDEIRKMVI